MTTEIQPIDRARAAQLVAAQVTGDLQMFAVAMQDTTDDDRDIAMLNVIRSLTEDLAGIVVDVYGDNAAAFVRTVLASHLAQADR